MILHDETTKVQGIPAHVLRGGSGIPLLIVHGWGSAAERYREAFRLIPEAAVSVVIPDLPGFGVTSPPPNTWSHREYVSWVYELLRIVGTAQPVVLGHSFGGGIALMLAVQHPEAVRALILYGARILTHRSEPKLSLFRTLAKAGKPFFQLPGLSSFAAPARRLLYRLAGARDYLSAGNLKPIFERVSAEDLSPALRHVSVPTGILWGREDRETPVSDAEYIHAAIPGSELRILDGVGHSIRGEQPERFVEELLRMIHRLTPLRPKAPGVSPGRKVDGGAP